PLRGAISYNYKFYVDNFVNYLLFYCFKNKMLSLQKSTNSVVIRYFYKERILVNLRNINRYKAILWLYSIYN
ncbi:MAG TPA: hypothetical protein DCR69_14090, partial [Clostridium sp.]|nr:hypothetical protein [Clostridium sp.]HBA03190.1 hypothetical protein [Clostridium sp.]